jgi:lysophospholipase L1-like esterase
VRARLLTATTLAAVLLSACTGGSTGAAAGGSGGGSDARAGSPDASSAEVEQYAALGDSYTAAPFVPVTDFGSDCLRSTGNYPQLLAQALGATVSDVSCGGATTADLTSPQVLGRGRGTVPAQVRAVRRGTDLVTVGVGGNDGALFTRLAVACIGRRLQPLARCEGLAGAVQDAGRVIAETGRRVAEALRAVAEAAPRADVVLVGYPRLADPARSCAVLPLSATDRTAVARLEQRLDDALRRAASAADARFLDVYALSRGHEVCSADPWVNGGRTDPQRALAFHPFAAEQQAIADGVLDLLREEK